LSVRYPKISGITRGLLAVAAAAALAACSTSGSSSAGTGGSGGAAGSGSGQGAAASGSGSAQAAYDKAFAGVIGTAPTASVKPKGKVLAWVVSCGQQVPTCAEPAGATVAAANAAGWQAKLCDGKLNPQGWAACIRQGISAKASGIIVIGQDCGSFQAALQEAKAAGIPTVGAGGNDCDVTGGAKLYSAAVQNLPGYSAQQWWAKLGALQADWIIGKTGGQAQVLSLQFTDAIWGAWIEDGFVKELGTCGGCKVVGTLKVGNADVASGQLPQKLGTALLKVPTATAVNVPLDGWFFAGLSQAIQSSGRSSQLAVIGAFGEPGNLDLIRKGTGEDATVGFNAEWVGWAGADDLGRLLANQPVQPAGVGLQAIDAMHNMPAAGTSFQYQPPVDYASAYQKAWGVE
jgi:ribose transport system substrate-binding protein